MVPTTWLVEYHQQAVEEYAALKDNKQKKGVLTVADFLRQLGPKMKEPHSKPVKGTAGALRASSERWQGTRAPALSPSRRRLQDRRDRARGRSRKCWYSPITHVLLSSSPN